MIIDMGQNNRRYGKVVFYIPEKGMRRNRRKIFGEGNMIFFRGGGKGYKYLEKENPFFGRDEKRRRKKGKIIGEKNSIFFR